MANQDVSEATRDVIAQYAVENEILRRRNARLVSTVESLQDLVDRLQRRESSEEPPDVKETPEGTPT